MTMIVRKRGKSILNDQSPLFLSHTIDNATQKLKTVRVVSGCDIQVELSREDVAQMATYIRHRDAGGVVAEPQPLPDRYGDGEINRAYWLSQAMIYFRSHQWGHIDAVAKTLSNEDVAAFKRVVEALNGEPIERQTIPDSRE
jgi:hypothetical protein